MLDCLLQVSLLVLNVFQNSLAKTLIVGQLCSLVHQLMRWLQVSSEDLNFSIQVICQSYFGWICTSTAHHHPEKINLAVVCGDQLATSLPVHHRDEAVERGGVLRVLVNILLKLLLIQVFRVESCPDRFFKIDGKRFLVILPVPWSSHYVKVFQLCLSWFH